MHKIATLELDTVVRGIVPKDSQKSQEVKGKASPTDVLGSISTHKGVEGWSSEYATRLVVPKLLLTAQQCGRTQFLVSHGTNKQTANKENVLSPVETRTEKHMHIYQ